MGSQLNPSGDKIPPQAMYEACRVVAKYVTWKGGLVWDFHQLMESGIDPDFETCIRTYLEDVLQKNAPHKGWKLPETTLVYPWIARMFPETRFIQWIRDPRDCILGKHVTDNLERFGIHHPPARDIYEKRVISWLYQYNLVKATPAPKYLIKVRFEDFVLDQERTLRRLEAFLDMPLSRIVVRADSVGRWKHQIEHISSLHSALEIPLVENGYPLPTNGR